MLPVSCSSEDTEKTSLLLESCKASKAWCGHCHGCSITRPGSFPFLDTWAGDARKCSIPIAQKSVLWGCNILCGSVWTSTGYLSWWELLSLSLPLPPVHPQPACRKGLLKAVMLISASCYPDEPRLPCTVVAPEPCRKQLTLLMSLCQLFIKALLAFRTSTWQFCSEYNILEPMKITSLLQYLSNTSALPPGLICVLKGFSAVGAPRTFVISLYSVSAVAISQLCVRQGA